MKIQYLNYEGKNSHTLTIEYYELLPGESLLVCGRNGSGKSLLAGILTGEIMPDQGIVDLPPRVGFIGFALEDQILEQDRKMDRSEDMEGGIDWGRTAGEIIGHGVNRAAAIDLSGIENLLEKPFKILSTGEIRKVLMARALASDPDLLVLDAPYAGLDIESRGQLTHIINTIIGQGTDVILVDFYHPDLPRAIENMIYLEKGKIVLEGRRDAVVNSQEWADLNRHDIRLPHHLPDCFAYDHLNPHLPFVQAKNISVSFNDKPVFTNLNWIFNPGENWHILGPNGCGKSTLLKLISGDSTKAYGQDLTLFGIKRGSGESIWDIKRHYGIVGAELHRDYRVSAPLLGVVISGFFDTIGLYDTPTATQITVAKQWIRLLDLGEKEQTYFSTLSYGEQRLALIARAVVKLPLILILDEPCQGLDNINRARVLRLIDYISTNSNTHILFVSHDPRDHLECLTHQLKIQSFT